MKTLQNGDRITSPGGQFTYEIIGPCCQLFDRSTLPYPHCHTWQGFKMPSWNRVGKQFIPDRSVLTRASYSMQLLDKDGQPWGKPTVRVHWIKLTKEEASWWYSKPPYLRKLEEQGQELVAA